MKKDEMFQLDPAFNYIGPKQNLYQELHTLWFDMTEIPPIDRVLYVCYNHKEETDYGDFMKCTIFENVKYIRDSNNVGHFMRCVDEAKDIWKLMEQPNYWAIKVFPEPPILWL